MPAAEFKNSPFAGLKTKVTRDPRSKFARALGKSKGKQKQARKNGYKGVVQNSPEFARIMSIPQRELDLDDVTDLTCIFRKPGGTMELRALQSASLIEAAMANGLFGPIPVGEGKTLVMLLMAEAMDSERTVLLVPPQLRDQLKREIDEVYGVHFNLPMDRVVRILAYSELSLAKNTGLLDELDPDLIVADEVHNLRIKKSARTKRFRRFMRENPHCRFVGLSGTMTNRSVLDYAHLIELALKKNSPLPIGHKELQLWAGALDVKPGKPVDPGVLKMFLKPEDKGNIRLGYRRRLLNTQGVIASDGTGIGTSLLVRSIKPEHVPSEVEDALDEVKSEWAYNGEEYASPIAFWRFCRQMSSGFYYRWVWPNGAPDDADRAWLEARSAWKKAVRARLEHAGEGMDSELLLTNAAERWRKKVEDHSKCEFDYQADENGDEVLVPTECRHYPNHPEHCTEVKTVRPGVGAKLFPCEEYITWKKVKGHYNPSPPTEAVWVSDFIVHDAIKRARMHAKKGMKVIIWYVDRVVGEKLEQVSRLPRFGEGADASNAKYDIIICSIATQGTGKNLQYYNAGIIITMPTNGKDFEQLAGREHRPGQDADLVLLEYYDHTESLDKCMNDVIADAMYIQDTNGGQQKILYADGEGIARKKIAQRKILNIAKKQLENDTN